MMHQVIMKGVWGLIVLWDLLKFSRAQCALESQYFCNGFPKDYPEGIKSIIFVVSNVGVLNSTVFTSENLQSVTSLTLANSEIVAIESGALRNFQGLTRLSLYGNHLSTILPSWFDDPAHLENLTIFSNKITELQPQMLGGFTGLTVLNLNGNNIRKVASGTFKSLSKLSFLDLSKNQISYLERNVLSHLQNATVRLGLNPWNCSCDLQDFSFFLQELINSSQLEDAAEVMCNYPPNLIGAPVWNISYTNCSSPVITTPLETSASKLLLPALLVVLVIVLFISLLLLLWKKKQDKKQIKPQEDRAASKDGGGTGRCHRAGPESKPPINTQRTMVGRAKSASAILLKEDFLQTSRKKEKLDTNLSRRQTQEIMEDEDVYFTYDVSDSNKGLWSYYRLRSGKKTSPASRSLPVSGMHTVSFIENRVNVGQGGNRGNISQVEHRANVSQIENHSNVGQGGNRPNFGLIEHHANDGQAEYHANSGQVEHGANIGQVEQNANVGQVADHANVGQVENQAHVGHSQARRLCMTSMPTQHYVDVHLPPALTDLNLENMEPLVYLSVNTAAEEPFLSSPRNNKVAQNNESVKTRCLRRTLSWPREKVRCGEDANASYEQFLKVLHLLPRPGGKLLRNQKINDETFRDVDYEHFLTIFNPTEERFTKSGFEKDAPEDSTFTKGKKGEPKCHDGFHRNTASTNKGYQQSMNYKHLQKKRVNSPETGVQRGDLNSQDSVERADRRKTPDDNSLLDNNEYNFIDLLHEVVENHGRWTRERWRQIHQQRLPSRSSPQT